jgi:hypothetical protein
MREAKKGKSFREMHEIQWAKGNHIKVKKFIEFLLKVLALL